MRRVVTGAGPDGRSFVVSDTSDVRRWSYASRSDSAPHDNPRDVTVDPLGFAHPTRSQVGELWTVRDDGVAVRAEDPRDYTDEPGGHSLDVPAGTARFAVTTFGPGYSSTIHTTDSIDLDICISGELELVLDEGSVTLRPGDSVIVPGVRHAWRTGQGATWAFVMLSPHSTGYAATTPA
jgi:quercetin dioxygenase-like cupin family protein